MGTAMLDSGVLAGVVLSVQKLENMIMHAPTQEDLDRQWERMLVYMQKMELDNNENRAAIQKSLSLSIIDEINKLKDWREQQELRWSDRLKHFENLLVDRSTFTNQIEQQEKITARVTRELREAKDSIAVNLQSLGKVQDVNRALEVKIKCMESAAQMQRQRQAAGKLCKALGIFGRSAARGVLSHWCRVIKLTKARETAITRGIRITKLLRQRFAAHHFKVWKEAVVSMNEEKETELRRKKKLLQYITTMRTAPLRSAWIKWRRSCLFEDTTVNTGKFSPRSPKMVLNLSYTTDTNVHENKHIHMNASMIHTGEISPRSVGRLQYAAPESQLEKVLGNFEDEEGDFARGMRQRRLRREQSTLERDLHAITISQEPNGRMFDGNQRGRSTLTERLAFLKNDEEGQLQLLAMELQQLKTVQLHKFEVHIDSAIQEIQRRQETVVAEIDDVLETVITPAVLKLQHEVSAHDERFGEVVTSLQDVNSSLKSEIVQLAEGMDKKQVALACDLKFVKTVQAAANATNIEMEAKLRKNQQMTESAIDDISSQGASLKMITERVEITEKDIKMHYTSTNARFTRSAADIEVLGESLDVVSTNANKAHNTLLRSLEDAVQKLIYMIRGPYKPDMNPIIAVATYCEAEAMRRNYVGPIPSRQSQPLALFASEYSRYIADSANLEALQRIVSGANPDELVYSDDSVQMRRQEMLGDFGEVFMSAVQKAGEGDLIESNNRVTSGATRMEVRRKLQQRLIEAIDAALSRYDQVLVSGNTRFGRVKAVPVCVACDRPLRSKTRLTAPVVQASTAVTSANNIIPSYSTNVSSSIRADKTDNDVYEDAHHEAVLPEESPRVTEGATKSSRPITKRPAPAVSTTVTNNLTSGTGGGAANNQEYIYRGGFKMPKHAPSVDDGGSRSLSRGRLLRPKSASGAGERSTANAN